MNVLLERAASAREKEARLTLGKLQRKKYHQASARKTEKK